MGELGVWIGEPLLVVNMNVSWMRYAPLWILERIPEVYEVALAQGVSEENINRWRRHTLPGIAHFFSEIYADDPLNNAEFFSAKRLIERFGRLPEFAAHRAGMLEVYSKAHAEGHPAATIPPEEVFGSDEIQNLEGRRRH